jgi:hypothetical protein
MRVEALTTAAFDPENFEIKPLKDAATRHSAGQLSFTR